MKSFAVLDVQTGLRRLLFTVDRCSPRVVVLGCCFVRYGAVARYSAQAEWRVHTVIPQRPGTDPVCQLHAHDIIRAESLNAG